MRSDFLRQAWRGSTVAAAAVLGGGMHSVNAAPEGSKSPQFRFGTILV
jgi:NAD(P)H-dependent FMN reductase